MDNKMDDRNTVRAPTVAVSVGSDMERQRIGAQTFGLSREHAGLRRLQRWVAINGALKLSHSQAAEIASLEPHYFSVTFHQFVGRSFLEWRRRCRAEVAVYLIMCSELSMNEIANLVGYRDRRSLERAVKSLTGRRPSSFRVLAV